MDLRGVPLVPTDNPRYPFAYPSGKLPLLPPTSTMRETSHPSLAPAANFFVAAFAAWPARLVVHPLSVARACAQAGVPGFKTGPIRSMYWMYRLEGVGSYAKGLPISLVKSCPQMGVQFGVFDALTKVVMPQLKLKHNNPSLLAFLGIYVCGGVAGATAQALLHPLDVIKTRLFVQGIMAEPSYASAVDCFQKILTTDGLLGLYRGFGPSIIGAYVFCGQMFATWDFFNRLPWIRRKVELMPFESWMEHLAAVSIASFVSAPFDVVRRKLMAFDRHLPLLGRTDVAAQSISSTVRLSHARGGLPAFWAGYFSSVLKVAPQVVVFYVVFKLTQGAVLKASSKNEAA